VSTARTCLNQRMPYDLTRAACHLLMGCWHNGAHTHRRWGSIWPCVEKHRKSAGSIRKAERCVKYSSSSSSSSKTCQTYSCVRHSRMYNMVYSGDLTTSKHDLATLFSSLPVAEVQCMLAAGCIPPHACLLFPFIAATDSLLSKSTSHYQRQTITV
jgi:hypothetical protein